MLTNIARCGLMLYFLCWLGGCTNNKPVFEQGIEDSLNKGKAVAIFCGSGNDGWVHKDNPNFKVWPKEGYSIAYLEPGTYVYYMTDWTNKMQHEKYQTVPKILSSSLGRVTRANIMVKERRSCVESVWFSEEGVCSKYIWGKWSKNW